MKNTPEKVKNYFQSLPIWAQVLALAEAVVVLVGLVVLLVATASTWLPPIAATVFVIWMIYGKLREAKESNAVKKYSLQGTTQGRYLTGGVPPVRFSM
ncbi:MULTISPECIES: hypothetical protein [Anaerotruncus]|uniref:DUF4133 domain-containing protein n=1 Tax=Anaerotruncus massiliensis (ex Togo et al. 2019) TaxID=1673720 RepID=A0ABR7AFH3_9FIRM|nr:MULTISPECIES: hypothetical protein [Anaerotruncus]MBC3939180.1 hypothetical protein [Anaerotruncus massiliensis (ex Togo et al. 2019)]